MKPVRPTATHLSHSRLLGTRWLAIGVFFASCAGPKQYLKGEDTALLSYSKSMCFGPCPAFTLEVDSDGSARFNGRAHIQPEGAHTGTWSQEDLQSLAAIAHASRLDHKAGTYDNPLVMDLPSTQLNMGPYRVLDRMNGPDLSALYNALDSLISVTNWVPAEETTGEGPH